jgi:hypothetical protein
MLNSVHPKRSKTKNLKKVKKNETLIKHFIEKIKIKKTFRSIYTFEMLNSVRPRSPKSKNLKKKKNETLINILLKKKNKKERHFEVYIPSNVLLISVCSRPNLKEKWNETLINVLLKKNKIKKYFEVNYLRNVEFRSSKKPKEAESKKKIKKMKR